MPGDVLPSEREMSRAFGVTRMTVRQALGALQASGVVLPQQGKGTFVATRKIERQAAKLVPFTLSMQQRGYFTQARVIAIDLIQPEKSVSGELALARESQVYFILRVRVINGEPILLERLTVPESRFPQLDRFNLGKRSLYEVMETEYGVRVRRARQSLEATAATAYEAELLSVVTGSPLMLERRLAYDEDDRPVEHARDLFRGDRFRFITETAPLEL